MMDPRTRRVLRTVSALAALTLLVQLAAMATPEWVVEQSPPTLPGSAASLTPTPDPSISATAAAEAEAALAAGGAVGGPAMKAHLGLFHVSYRLGAMRQEDVYGFCNGASPAFSLEKCLTWRASQAAALASGALAYAALVLLLVAASNTLKARALEYTLSWSWTLSFLGGFLAWGSCLAFFLLMLVFRREHRARKDGMTVEVGFALLGLAAVGCMYILLPFIRMVLHKWAHKATSSTTKAAAAAAAAVSGDTTVGEESVAPESFALEEGGGVVVVEDDKDEVVATVGRVKAPHGRHGQHSHGFHHHHHHHHNHHRRRHSREMAAAEAGPVGVVVHMDEELHVMST